MRTSSANSGFTLIEIVVAFALLMVLVMLALGVISGMQGPATEVTLRADMDAKGNATFNLLREELQSGNYEDPEQTVGDYSGGDVINFRALGDPGPAIKTQTITGVTGSPPDLTPELGDEVIYAFVQGPAGDGDRDGLSGEWRLVRVSPPGGEEITIQPDICDPSQPGVPTGVTVLTPSFEINDTGCLHVCFTLAKQTGYDTRTNTRLYSFVSYDRSVELRNAKKPN